MKQVDEVLRQRRRIRLGDLTVYSESGFACRASGEPDHSALEEQSAACARNFVALRSCVPNSASFGGNLVDATVPMDSIRLNFELTC